MRDTVASGAPLLLDSSISVLYFEAHSYQTVEVFALCSNNATECVSKFWLDNF